MSETGLFGAQSAENGVTGEANRVSNTPSHLRASGSTGGAGVGRLSAFSPATPRCAAPHLSSGAAGAAGHVAGNERKRSTCNLPMLVGASLKN